MKFGKKLLAVLLAGVLALAMLTACGGSTEKKMSADNVANAINEIRVNDYHKASLPRLSEIEKLYEPAAEAAAEYAANRTDENEQKALDAIGRAYDAMVKIRINGKAIDVKKTEAVGNYDMDDSRFERFIACFKDPNLDWNKRFISNDEVVGMAVVYAEKDGHSYLQMVSVVLEDEE